MQVDRTSSKQSLIAAKQSRLYWTIRARLFESVKRQRSLIDSEQLSSFLKVQLNSKSMREEIELLTKKCNVRHQKVQQIIEDPNQNINSLKLKWTELLIKSAQGLMSKVRRGQFLEDVQTVTYAYDSQMLLSFVNTAKFKSFEIKSKEVCLLFYGMFLQTVSLQSFQIKFKAAVPNQASKRERQKLQKKVIDEDTFDGQLQDYLCGGCLPGIRCKVYQTVLNIEETVQNSQIKLSSELYNLLLKGSNQEVLWSQDYFIFKEEIQGILKFFGMDTSVPQKLLIYPQLLDKLGWKASQLPPNRIIPSKNISKLVAPFAYLSLKRYLNYQIFREVYCRYFCFLQSIGSMPNSLLRKNLTRQLLLVLMPVETAIEKPNFALHKHQFLAYNICLSLAVTLLCRLS